MSEIEQYLAQIRSSLDVSPARADEVIAEARCHLEARVREFAAKGMSREQAVVAAVRGFGAPHAVAAELRKANARHRDAGLSRVLLGIAVAFGVSLSLGQLLAGPGWRELAVIRFLTSHMHINELPAVWLTLMVGALPGALLSGLAAGRRYWWVAATPPLFFIALVWIVSLVYWQTPYGTVPDQLVHALVWPLLIAGVFAAGGYLGARVGEARRLRYPIGALCALYALGISVSAFPQAVSNLRDLVLVIAIAQGAACVVLLAAYQERLVSQRVLIVAGAGMTALVATMGVVVLSGTWGLNTLFGEGRIAFILSLAAVVFLPAALVWRGMRDRRASGRERLEG